MNIRNVMPPSDPVTRWRWVVAVCVVLLSFNALSGRGLLLDRGQYAYAADVAEQGDKIDRILLLQIASSLRQLKHESCRSNGNKRLIEDTIESYQQQYFEIARRRYPLPPCEDNYQ